MANIVKTFTFVNSQPADATQVNKNFDDLLAGINADVSATDKVLGRATAGAGPVEEIPCTAAGRALIDDANAAAQLATLGAVATGDSRLSDTRVASDVSAWAKAATPSACWPVGSVFTSVVDTNPNTLLGFGTWGAIAAGRVLLGLDSGDADFNAARETGGAKTVAASAQSFTGSGVVTGTSAASVVVSPGTGYTVSQSSHIHAVTAAGTNAPGAATSVVQPYFVVYFWERTA